MNNSSFPSPFSDWPLESKFVDGSRDRDRMDMDPKWLSLAAASKQELQTVTDILTGVIRCVSLHPHPLWSPCPAGECVQHSQPLANPRGVCALVLHQNRGSSLSKAALEATSSGVLV